MLSECVRSNYTVNDGGLSAHLQALVNNGGLSAHLEALCYCLCIFILIHLVAYKRYLLDTHYLGVFSLLSGIFWFLSSFKKGHEG